jgi:hypothetical protein
MMSAAIKQTLHRNITNILVTKIEPMFKDGVEITLIARTPGNSEADVLVTSERNFDEIKALVDRSAAREAV